MVDVMYKFSVRDIDITDNIVVYNMDRSNTESFDVPKWLANILRRKECADANIMVNQAILKAMQ